MTSRCGDRVRAGMTTRPGAVRIAGHTRVERARFGLGWNKFGMMAATATAAADAVFVRVPR